MKQTSIVKRVISLMSLNISLLLSSMSFAYVGPGAGVSAIGSAIAFLVLVFLLFVGFLWYPLKRVFSKNNKKHSDKNVDKDGMHSDQSQGL